MNRITHVMEGEDEDASGSVHIIHIHDMLRNEYANKCIYDLNST